MCMQDLAIVRNCSWRPVANVVDSTGGRCKIPQNVKRIALYIGNGGSGNNNINVRLSDSGTGAIINQLSNAATGSQTLNCITQEVFPAMGSLDLYADTTAANVVAWELVPNTDLDTTISVVSREITHGIL